MTNTILQITRVSPSYIDYIKTSFDDLPKTDHADGSYRLRKYSHVSVDCTLGAGRLEKSVGITDLNVKQFTQSYKYNKHQGGMSRDYDGIDVDVLNSPGIRAMAQVFSRTCDLGDRFTMDIHQMRVRCQGGATQLSPEGWHQDGYDCVAMIGIDRNNIIGGEILLSTSKTESPFLTATLDPGTMVIIDDSVLWHNGRSIQPINDDEPAWVDVLVFTAKK